MCSATLRLECGRLHDPVPVRGTGLHTHRMLQEASKLEAGFEFKSQHCGSRSLAQSWSNQKEHRGRCIDVWDRTGRAPPMTLLHLLRANRGFRNCLCRLLCACSIKQHFIMGKFLKEKKVCSCSSLGMCTVHGMRHRPAYAAAIRDVLAAPPTSTTHTNAHTATLPLLCHHCGKLECVPACVSGLPS